MLKTLNLALEVLKMFTRDKTEWGGRELATELQENYTKIYRILETLEGQNFLSKDPKTKKYSLGFGIMELGLIKYESTDVKQIIHPLLEKLSDETGESVFLTILDKDKAITLDAVEPKNTVKYSVTVGSKSPLYVGASYRSILAYMTEEQVEEILKPENLKKYTENTMTDPDQLKADLEAIRQQGWAISKGEYTADVIAIAVPLFVNKEVIGSLTVSGPVYRNSDEQTKQYLQTLLNTRAEVQEIIAKYELKLWP